MKNLKEKAIKSVFWVGSTRFITQTFSWLITIVLVRILCPSDFGLFALGFAYYAIIQVLYDLNISSAILQKKDLTDEELFSSFWFIIALSVLLYIFSWFFADMIGNFFGNERLPLIIKTMGIGLVLQSIKVVPHWLLARNLDFEKRAKAAMYTSFICNLVAIIGALLGFGVWALVFRIIARELCLTFFTYLFYPWKPSIFFSLKKLTPLIKYGISITSFGIAKYFSEKSDTIIIGKFLGDNLLGHYSVAVQLSRMPIDKVILIVNQVCFPVFSKLQDELEELKSYFLKVTRLIGLFAFPILCGAIVINEELVYVALGSKWLSIVFILKILCAVAIPQTIAGTVTALNNARGKPKRNFYFALSLSIILTLGILIGIKFGLNGVAMAWGIVYPAIFLYFLYRTVKDIDLSLILVFKNLLDPIIGSLFMMCSVWIVKKIFMQNEEYILLLCLYLSVGIIAYVAYFCLFAKTTFIELAEIAQHLNISKFFKKFKIKTTEAS